jgi:aminoglycoside phosphotransferase family enzyme
MEKSQIITLMKSMDIPETALIETHISWVILSDVFAYKIKRPVRFSFLDFTTLDQRHQYCLHEVLLNQRLTKGIYLGIVPVRQSGSSITMTNSKGTVIDYAVKMRRIPGDRQMDIMLRKGLVTPYHIEQISEQLAVFHASARVMDTAPDVELMLADFTDLSNCVDLISSRFGTEGLRCLEKGITCAATFLHVHTARIQERHALGFVIDGHGDLHSKNIFLLDSPVIFDCIEFSDHLRHVDVLDELAFFSLDLELLGYQDLATHFLEHYNALNPCILNGEDMQLFSYYKLYRAGVKLKINCIKAEAATDITDKQQRLAKVDAYYNLFERYLRRITQEENGIKQDGKK